MTTDWAMIYATTILQRDKAMIVLTISGVLLFINVMAFIKRKSIANRDPAHPHRWLLGIILGAIVVRVAFIWVSPPWYDEAFSVLITRLPFVDMINAIAGDVHPPLWYVLMWPLGGNLLWMRSASVGISIASLVVLWRLTATTDMSDNARLLTVAVIAFLPTEIYYGQEARMYALLQLLVLLTFYETYRNNLRRMTIYAILLLYTHNYGLYYCALIYAVAFLQVWACRRYDGSLAMTRAEIGKIIMSGTIALIAFVPWMTVLARQMGQLTSGYWIKPSSPGSVLYDLLQIVFGVFTPEWAVIPAGITLGALLVGVAWYGFGHYKDVLIMSLGVIVLALLTEVFYRPVMLFRALLPSLAFMAMIIANAVTKDRRAWAWAIPAGAILLIATGYLIYGNSTGESHPQPVMLEPAQSQSPRVIHLNDATLLGYMIKRPDQQHYLLYKRGCHMDGALSNQTRLAIGITAIDESDLVPGDELAMIVGPLANPCMVDEFHHLESLSHPVVLLEKKFWTEGVWIYDGY